MLTDILIYREGRDTVTGSIVLGLGKDSLA